MLTKSRVVQLLFMLTVLVGLFFWRTFNVNLEKYDKQSVAQVSLLRCDYQVPCEFITEQGEFLLTIQDLPIKAEEWIHFNLATPNKNTQITHAEIRGKTMFMGKVPVTFTQVAEQQFSSKVILGACTTDEMIWTLEITTQYEDKENLLSFDFLIKQ